MWSFTKEQAQQLEDLESDVAFAHRGPNRKLPEEQQTEVTIATLIDRYRRQTWAEAKVEGSGEDGERRALEAVLKAANPAKRPMTPAEAMKQLAAYKEKFGDLPPDESKPTKKTKDAKEHLV